MLVAFNYSNSGCVNKPLAIASKIIKRQGNMTVQVAHLAIQSRTLTIDNALPAIMVGTGQQRTVDRIVGLHNS